MKDDWSDVLTCPVCGDMNCVPPYDPSNSPVLLVGSEPGKEEILRSTPFVGNTGTILRIMFAMNGWDINQFAVCNLWQHEKLNKSDHNYEKCLLHGRNEVVRIAKNKSAILLMGADTVKIFTGLSVLDVCGLLVTSDFLSAPTIMASVNPAFLFNKTRGELELAIEKFCTYIEPLYEH